jgi:selenocysteine lyase/cysteine desulfurase
MKSTIEADFEDASEPVEDGAPFAAVDLNAPTMSHMSDAVAVRAYEDFLRRYPAYAATAALDDLRTADYARLDRTGHVYLDYTGGSLYAESQLRLHHELLSGQVFGNPHSNNPTSLAMTHLVEQARASVLAFFNADPAEYAVVFTPNASGALKHVGECYPFSPGGRFLITFDNHNSVNGIREFARARGARVTYVPVETPDMRLDPARVRAELANVAVGKPSLFAFPAQSNFTGVQHPLALVAEAQAAGWDVLLDCAAFVPTNRLDLSTVKPDFVPLSFYKMFGYPTGAGALIVRRSKLRRLRRPWFAGGTITVASVQGEGWHTLIDSEAAFEDGTVNYLSLPAVEIGLRHLETVGRDAVHDRVMCLTGWLLEEMAALRHSNGARMIRVFGPLTTEARGATIAFNFFDPDGVALDFRRTEALAGAERISLRSGCFCNPGAGEIAHDIRPEQMARCFAGEHAYSFAEFYALMQSEGKSPSTLRISLGIASNFADAWRFVRFAAALRDRSADEINALPVSDPHPASVRDVA